MSDAFISAAIITPLRLLGTAAVIFVIAWTSDRAPRAAEDSDQPR